MIPHFSSRCRKSVPSLVLAGFLLATAVLSGCQAKPDAEFVNLPANTFARKWKAPLALRNDQISRLTLIQDKLLATSRKNTVYVLNAASGKLLHADAVVPGGVPIRKPAQMPNDQILYPTIATLEIFDKEGKRVQSVPLGHAARSGAAVANDGTIYVGLDYGNGGRLAALDLKHKYNFTRWELQTSGGGLSSTPVIHHDLIYFANENGKVFAINSERVAVWNMPGNAFETDAGIVADLRVDDDGVYVASLDSKMYCLDRSTGKVKWQYYAGTALREPPTVTADTAYLFVPGTGLVALDKTKGEYNRTAKWVAADDVAFLSQDEKYIYARRAPSGGSSVIDALDKETGQIAFTSTEDSELSVFATNSQDSTIYGATTDGTIVAVRPVLKPGSVGQLVLVPVSPERFAAAN